MKLFSWLRRKAGNDINTSENTNKNIILHKEIINPASPKDDSATSPDGKYKLKISSIDNLYKTHKFSIKFSICGYNEKIIYKSLCNIPTIHPKISNSGDCIFVDNPENVEDYSSLHICRQGDIRKVASEGWNLSSSISSNGEICALLNSIHPAGKWVFIYNTHSGKLINSWRIDNKNLKKITITQTNKDYRIILSSDELGNFDFSISGKAGSEAAYIDAELGKGNIYTVISRVDKILKAYRKADGIECLKELIPYIDKAPAPQFANEEHCRKEALLTKARIFEKIGDYSSALRDYEAAAGIYSTKQTEKKIATIKKRISAI